MFVCCDKKSACITALGGEDQAKGEGLRVEKAAVLWVAVEGVGGAEEGPGGRHHVARQLGRRPRGDQQREADHGCSCTLQGIRENISNSAVCLLYSVHAVQLRHACFFHRKSVCRSYFNFKLRFSKLETKRIFLLRKTLCLFCQWYYFVRQKTPLKLKLSKNVHYVNCNFISTPFMSSVTI